MGYSSELFGVELIVIDLITRSERSLNSDTKEVRRICIIGSSLTFSTAPFGNIVVDVFWTQTASSVWSYVLNWLP